MIFCLSVCRTCRTSDSGYGAPRRVQRWRGNDLMAFVVSAGPMHAYVGSAAGTGLERLGACAEASEGTDCARDDAGSFRLRGAELASWSAAGAACARRCGECARCRFFSFSVRWRDCSWYAACPTGPLTFMTRDFRTRRAANKTGAWGVGEGVDARRAAMHDIALAFGGMIGGFTGKSVFGHKDDVRVLQLTALAWRHALPSATVYLHSWSVELRDDIERELQPALSEYESPWVGSKPPHGCAAERASFASQATSRLRALQLATRNRQHALVVSTRFDVLPCQREPLLLPVQPMLIHAGALSWFRPFPRLDDSLLYGNGFLLCALFARALLEWANASSATSCNMHDALGKALLGSTFPHQRSVAVAPAPFLPWRRALVRTQLSECAPPNISAAVCFESRCSQRARDGASYVAGWAGPPLKPVSGGGARSKARVPPLCAVSAVRFVNYATGAAEYIAGQDAWARTAVSVAGADFSRQWNHERLLDTDFAGIWQQFVANVGQTEAAYRGGHFLWKPYIILRELEASPPGGFVVYSDVVRTAYRRGRPPGFQQSIRPLICWLAKQAANPLGLIGIFLNLPNGQYQRWHPAWPQNNMLVRNRSHLPRLLARAKMTPSTQQAVLDAWHVQATWSVWRRSDESLRLVREWLDLLTSAETVLTSNSDQTWLTLLAVKYNLTAPLAASLGDTHPNHLKNVDMTQAVLAAGMLPQFGTPWDTQGHGSVQPVQLAPDKEAPPLPLSRSIGQPVASEKPVAITGKSFGHIDDMLSPATSRSAVYDAPPSAMGGWLDTPSAKPTLKPSVIRGEWRPAPASLFWSKSTCPFEHEFQTCTEPTRAGAALRRFKPLHHHEVRGLPSVLEQRPASTLHLLGDSLVRQVYISLACSLWQRLPSGMRQASRARHLLCTKSIAGSRRSKYAEGSWPFENALSGFYDQDSPQVPCYASLRLPSLLLAYTGFSPGLLPIDTVVQTLVAPTGTVVLEAGVHGNDDERAILWTIRLARALRQSRPERKIIWLFTPPQHFQTTSGTGRYSEVSQSLQSAGADPRCATAVSPTRLKLEMNLLQQQGMLSDGTLDYFVALEGLESLGDTKVGTASAEAFKRQRLDCTHFCSPGPPLALAEALLAKHRELTAGCLNGTLD